MDPARWRSRRRRDHRLCAVAARRRRLCRIARDRPQSRKGQGGRGGRVGQSGERGLCAGFGRSRRSKRSDHCRSGEGQCRSNGQGLVHEIAPHRSQRAGGSVGRGGLPAVFGAGAALMRYLPLTERDREEMLAALGAPSIDALFAEVPAAARLDGPVGLPRAKAELEVERAISAMAARNVVAGPVPFFVGAGVYRHHIPAAVDHLIQRGEFLTSYTPYQPEISQGTLQYLFEFQTQVALLTGMEVANASLYDGATACAEAVMMAGRVTGRKKAVLSGGLHPHYREVCETYARFVGFELAADEAFDGGDLGRLIDRSNSCVV